MSERIRQNEKEFAKLQRKQRALEQIREAILCDSCETKETCLIKHSCKEDWV